MSGGYGWHQSSNSQNVNDVKNVKDVKNVNDHSYDDAIGQYKPVVSAVSTKKIGAPIKSTTPPTVSTPKINTASNWPKRIITNQNVNEIHKYPEAKHTLKSTASNVIIIVQDVTISMNTWPQEIFARLPTFYIEACEYLGSDDLEILFIAHGDVRTDNFPVQVSRFGRGQELDQILSSFYMRCGGGGQGDESQEIVAYYLLRQVDTSSAHNVYTFFITDEAACSELDQKYVMDYLGIKIENESIQTKDVFASLQRKSKVFTILCETKNDSYDPIYIRNFWESTVGKNNVISLNDSRRVVDVILGSIAKLAGQLAQFTRNLVVRQTGTQHAAMNIQTVQNSISIIGSNAVIPQNKIKKPLI